MAYAPQVVQAARERLEGRRQAADSQAAALQEKLCARIPRLLDIQRELTTALPAITRIILQGGDAAEIEKIQEKNLALQQEMADILHRAGFPMDNFEPQYTCPKCKDTGYENGKLCSCYRQLLQEEACRHLSSLSAVKLTDFDSLNMAYYEDTVDPRLGVSPRQHMQDIVTYCREYAQQFSPTNESLLLQGPTGVGKTHLALAIARVVTEKGFSVVYGSMLPLLRQLENEQFGRAEGDSMQHLTTCDLLVLDDLGMEFDTAFSRSCIYNVLNARLLEGRPTIISTNLSAAALQEKYGDQITSRIVGGFVPLLCVGKDVRQIIRRRSMN